MNATNLITDFPDLPEGEVCQSYIWLNMFSCGCLIKAGVCEIVDADHFNDTKWKIKYRSKTGRLLALNCREGEEPEVNENGILQVEGFIKADYCGAGLDVLLNDNDYYDRFKLIKDVSQ